MLGDYMTCTAMYGSGWGIDTVGIGQVVLLILGDLLRAHPGLSAVVAGTTSPPTAGRLFATTTRPAIASTASVFAW